MMDLAKGIAWVIGAASAFLIGFASHAIAQEDVFPLPVAGVYTLKAQAPADMTVGVQSPGQVCFKRVDVTPIAELGCVGGVGNNDVVTFDVTVPVTPGDDAEIRATAIDATGNESALSSNAARLDFTPPGAPVLNL